MFIELKYLKKVLLIVIILLFIGVTDSDAQKGRNPVLEYCTGTWCGYCPCGHAIIKNDILPNITNAIIIGYHGPANGSDPFSFFIGNSIINELFSTPTGTYYPTGTVDRTSAPISRGAWYSTMNSRTTISPNVKININKTYEENLRTLDLTVNVDPLTQLTGQYKVSVILLEDSLIASQSGNSSCIGGSNYIHDHVVRAMINNYSGDILNSQSPWNPGHIASINYKYTVPTTFVHQRCSIVVMVFKVGSSLNTSEIQQAEKWTLMGTVTSINSDNEYLIPENFALFPNYPNPFNPVTQIKFSIPHNSHVTLKLFDILGKEITTLVNEELKSGVYEIDFNGSNLTSGVYYYRLDAVTTDNPTNTFTDIRKMILMK